MLLFSFFVSLFEVMDQVGMLGRGGRNALDEMVFGVQCDGRTYGCYVILLVLFW